MNKLRYDNKWVEYEFITADEMATQLSEFENGDDKNSEHFRYRTFIRFITKGDNFSDLEIRRFIELVKIDSDQTMSGSALSELIKSGKLTMEQFEFTKPEFLKFGEWTNKVLSKIENART